MKATTTNLPSKRLMPKLLSLSIAALSCSAWADDTPDDTVANLGVLTITNTIAPANLLPQHNVSNQSIPNFELKQRGVNLGDSLHKELGIFANQMGNGASSPIIRGQEGKRIAILQNGSNVVDMSAMSPDHAVMTNTALARHVDVLRGATTLLYQSGNTAGVVNVVDDSIPTRLPQGTTGSVGIRLGSNDNEKLSYGDISWQMGDNIAVRVAGINRHADDYQIPQDQKFHFKNEKALKDHLQAPQKLESLEKEYQHFLANRHHQPYLPHRPKPEQHFIRKEGDYFKKKQEYQQQIITPQIIDRLPDSWARSQTGSVGISWIGNSGYLGMSMLSRQDRYGSPAHNPMYEGCGAYTLLPGVERSKPYLMDYPQLMSDDDFNYLNPRADCTTTKKAFNAQNPGSHSHDRQDKHGKPSVDLSLQRYDVRGELAQPITSIDKLRGHISYGDYQHLEKEGTNTNASFANKSTQARFEMSHQPINWHGKWTGILGIQHQRANTSAIAPDVSKGRQLLNNNRSDTTSVFALERYQWRDDLMFELSARHERQKIAVDYDIDKIKHAMQPLPNPRNSPYVDKSNQELAHNLAYALQSTKPYQEHALSYALGVHWQFLPNYKLSINASKQERLPTAQELYTHGLHLATNSFELGNKDLNKEKARTLEFGLAHQGDRLDYKINGYLYDFDNYIYLQTVNETLGASKVISRHSIRINRYNQAKARFYGLEGTIGYQINPTYRLSFFGDYINGKLRDLPDVVSDYNHYQKTKTYSAQPDTHTPRLPPMRLGTRLQANFNDRWAGKLEFYRTFAQHKLAKFEQPTPKHDMLNVGINYNNFWGNSDYEVFLQGNNLLGERVYAHETFLSDLPQQGRNFIIGLNLKF